MKSFISKKLLYKLLVPFLLGLGTMFSFFREITIAYYYGTSRDLEIFRIAFSIPYALFQSLGTVLVGALLPILIHEGQGLIFQIKRQVQKIFIIIAIIAALTTTWQAKILAPGFSSIELETLSINLLICWMILVISAFIFPIRLLLQEQNRKMIVSSTSLFYALSFIVFIFIFNNTFGKYDLSILAVASTSFVFLIYKIFSSVNTIIEKPQKSQVLDKKIKQIILGSFVYVLFLAVPRLIDKAVASKMDIGVIANLEYAMNFYVAFGVLIGTSFTIIYAKKIALEYRDNLSLLWIFKIVGVPFLLAAIVSLLIFPFSEDLVRLAYLRGKFTENNIMDVVEILQWFLFALPLMVSGMILLQVVAAYSIFILIGLAMIKSIVKLSWVIYFSSTSTLAIFGQSTFIMEFTAIIIMSFLFFNKKRQKTFK